jgi:hypothetical protein
MAMAMTGKFFPWRGRVLTEADLEVIASQKPI